MKSKLEVAVIVENICELENVSLAFGL